MRMAGLGDGEGADGGDSHLNDDWASLLEQERVPKKTGKAPGKTWGHRGGRGGGRGGFRGGFRKRGRGRA